MSKINRFIFAIFATFLVLIPACNPEKQPFVDNEPALFDDADLAVAGQVGISSQNSLLGVDLNNAVTDIEIEDPEATASPSEVTPLAVLPGVSGFLAYIRSNGTSWDIYSYDQANDVRTKILTTSEEVQSVAITANGTQVLASIYNAANSSFDVYLFSIAQKTSKRLSNTSNDETNVSMSAGGNVFVWEGKNAGKRTPIICDYDGSFTKTVLGYFTDQVEPSISSNGNYIAMVTLLSGTYKLRLYDRSANSYKTVAASSNPIHHPSCSDDGQRVAFLQDKSAANQHYYLKIKDLSTNILSIELYSLNPFDHPHLTADGNYLAYSREHQSGWMLPYTRELASNAQAKAQGGSYDFYGTYW